MIGVAWRQGGVRTPKEAVGNQSLWLQLLTLRAQPCNSSPKQKKKHLHVRMIHKWRHTESLHAAAGGGAERMQSTNTGRSQRRHICSSSLAARRPGRRDRWHAALVPQRLLTLGGYARARTARRSHARCTHADILRELVNGERMCGHAREPNGENRRVWQKGGTEPYHVNVFYAENEISGELMGTKPTRLKAKKKNKKTSENRFIFLKGKHW